MTDSKPSISTILNIEGLNALSADEATAELLKCCGSRRWAEKLSKGRPYLSLEELSASADEVWWSLEPADWLEAFHSHPKIGETKAANSGSAQAQQWSGQEQLGVRRAAPKTIEALARLNTQYETKFGYIFIVCATGKSSEDMLRILQERLENDAVKELPVSAAEQAKITALRLKKLLKT
jgi:2-oxo-4-hydroxy-4-carboxy-5-ureidoimidazoline decarboxylase